MRRLHYLAFARRGSFCGHMDKQGRANTTTNVRAVTCKMCLKKLAKLEEK